MRLRILLVGMALTAGAAAADEPAIGLFGSPHDDYQRAGAHVRLGPLWGRDFADTWHAAVHPEFEVSRFRVVGAESRRDPLDEIGGIALLRLTRGTGGVQPYGELGFGGALLSRRQLGEKVFSTAFQFSEHAGLGLEFGGRFAAGWRISHYSNGGVKKPNNGLNFHQVVLSASF